MMVCRRVRNWRQSGLAFGTVDFSGAFAEHAGFEDIRIAGGCKVIVAGSEFALPFAFGAGDRFCSVAGGTFFFIRGFIIHVF